MVGRGNSGVRYEVGEGAVSVGLRSKSQYVG